MSPSSLVDTIRSRRTECENDRNNTPRWSLAPVKFGISFSQQASEGFEELRLGIVGVPLVVQPVEPRLADLAELRLVIMDARADLLRLDAQRAPVDPVGPLLLPLVQGGLAADDVSIEEMRGAGEARKRG